MMASITTIFISDIEKAFRGHLPQSCINILAMMAEQSMMMEKALNDQERMLKTMLKAVTLSMEADKLMVQQLKKYNADYSDPHGEIVKNQEIKE
jgi:hypothetical protein